MIGGGFAMVNKVPQLTFQDRITVGAVGLVSFDTHLNIDIWASLGN